MDALFSGDPKLKSIEESLACGDKVAAEWPNDFGDGREFCLALNSAYYDAQSLWGEVSERVAEAYYDLRGPLCIPSSAHEMTAGNPMPAYSKEQLTETIEQTCTDMGAPLFTKKVFTKSHASFLFQVNTVVTGDSFYFTLEARLKGLPTLNGSIRQIHNKKPILHIPLATALCRIRWQVVPLGEIAIPGDLAAAVVEPITVYAHFLKFFLFDGR